MKLRRSKLLIASLAYWRWLDTTLGSFSNTSRRRSRTMFIGGGCLTWLVLIWVVLFFWLFVLSALVMVIAAFGVVGALLSAIGGIDELRLMLVHREPKYRLPPRPVPLRDLPPAPHMRPPPPVQFPPAAPLPPPPTIASGIRELVQLHESGALSDDEFTAAKAKLLGP